MARHLQKHNNIRNNSENYHIVGIDQIIMSPIELLKCCYQFSFLLSEMLYIQISPEHLSITCIYFLHTHCSHDKTNDDLQ